MATLTAVISLLTLCYLVREADARTVHQRITWLQQRAQHHAGYLRFIANHHLLDRNGCERTLWDGTPIPKLLIPARTQRVCARLGRIVRYETAALGWTRRELREALQEQRRSDWAWRSWLPDKWARIGACETGYGKRPGNWHWDSGRYVSAFGIYRPAYAQFAHLIGQPSWDEPGVRTPREQYNVAMAIYHRYGLSGWGCRNA